MKSDILDSKIRPITIKISDHLCERLETLLHQLKKLDDPTNNKRRWAIDAIKAKLYAEQNNPKNEKIEEPKEKARFVSFLINPSLEEEIEKIVDAKRAFKHGYSKKKWYVEAFLEQLEKDEQFVRNLQKKKKK